MRNMNSSLVMINSKSIFSSIQVVSDTDHKETIDEGYLPKIDE